MRVYGCVCVCTKQLSDLSVDVDVVATTASTPSSKLSLPAPKGPTPKQVSF